MLLIKKLNFIYLAVMIISCFYAVSAECGNSQPLPLNKDVTLLIHGLGYPPIKAQSTAQARLMAKRAATIDAYRNALVKAGFSEYNEESFYSGISGFVSGMTVLNEEYLKDGGIRLTALIQVKDVTVTSSSAAASKAAASKKPVEMERSTGPSAVELNEWYKLIEKIVIIEK